MPRLQSLRMSAGHQLTDPQRANLAFAIAQDMGLGTDDCTGIKLAGQIHDIGKMQVPIEFLVKPTTLNDFEMALIRMHPEVGFNIIKDIPFTWPVAEMVRQHHERLDGSGYPRGLTSDQILPGAKILAVADVLEAMSSHRPYHPTKGLDAAMEDLKQQRGKTLDAQVVDSCLRLLCEQGYQIGEAV